MTVYTHSLLNYMHVEWMKWWGSRIFVRNAVNRCSTPRVIDMNVWSTVPNATSGSGRAPGICTCYSCNSHVCIILGTWSLYAAWYCVLSQRLVSAPSSKCIIISLILGSYGMTILLWIVDWQLFFTIKCTVNDSNLNIVTYDYFNIHEFTHSALFTVIVPFSNLLLTPPFVESKF